MSLKKGQCRSCQADILWGVTANNKAMPIEEADDGNIVVEDDGSLRVLDKGQQELFVGQRYISHFATCPHASQHRRPK